MDSVQQFEFDEVGFRELIAKHWQYHRPCRDRLYRSSKISPDVTQVEFSPIYQEVLGGNADGLRFWSGYSVNLTDFFAEPEVEVSEFGFSSYCSECAMIPFVGIRGTYKQEKFVAMIYLEPSAVEPIELINGTNRKGRRKGNKS